VNVFAHLMSMAVPKQVLTGLHEILLYENRCNVMLKHFVPLTLRLIDMISHVNFKCKCISHVPLQVVSGRNHEKTFKKSLDVILDGYLLIN
jgi:hypothetical protein